MGFQIKLLNGPDPSGQYAAMQPHDDHIFYILSNGMGYLGDVLLFNAKAEGLGELVQAIDENDLNETKTASVKAIADYVAAKCTAVDALTTKFFRHVVSHTLTAENLADPNVSVPEGCKAGDIGLAFTQDTDGEDNGNETWLFVPLSNYFNAYTFQGTSSIHFTHDASTNTVKADLKIDTQQQGPVGNDYDDKDGVFYITERGIALNMTWFDNGTGDKSYHIRGTSMIPENKDMEPSQYRLVSEKIFADFIENHLLPYLDERYARFSEDNDGDS